MQHSSGQDACLVALCCYANKLAAVSTQCIYTYQVRHSSFIAKLTRISYHKEIMASVLTDYPEQNPPRTHLSVTSEGILQMQFHVDVCANSITNKDVLI